MKKKAMLISTGTGDGTENGIITSIKDSMPDYITFIITEESRKTYEKVIDRLGDEYFGEEELIRIQGGEENDFQVVYSKIIECIDEYIENGIKKDNIFIDITFGTKAMTAGMITAGIYKKIPHIKYVSGQRSKKNGTVISGTERIISTMPSEIFNKYFYDDLKTLFNKFDFDASIKILDNITENFFYDNYLGYHKETYENLIISFNLWDKFNYKKAFGQLKKTKEKIKLVKDFNIEKYQNNYRFLEKLSEGQKYSKEMIVDIFLNAKRRMIEGKFDDALIRLYRVMELISQNTLYEKYNIDPSNIKEDQLKILPPKIIEKLKSKKSKKTTSGVTDNYEILSYNGDVLGKKYCQSSNIKEIMGIRNISILIHGENPVNKENFDKLLEIVEDFFATFFASPEEKDRLLTLAEMADFN